jgi:hypothetical protein
MRTATDARQKSPKSASPTAPSPAFNTGEHFNPHVSTGVATRDYLDKMLAEPFKPFTFSPAGAAVYQLGPFGTAAKKLKAWELKR